MSESHATVSYADAKGGASSAPDTGIETRKVVNTYSTSAGASSGDFHKYRATRAVETRRIADMIKEDALKKHQEDVRLKIKRNDDDLIERTKKNASKRQRKKAQKLAKRAVSKKK